jgi:thiol-disulfide isomerase/thioredoxin
MRFVLLSVLLLSVLLPTTSFAARAAEQFVVPTLDGEFSLQEHKGQVVLLDFWASWCGPCRHSFPWMNQMEAKYAEQGLKIIAISLDAKKESTTRFLKKYPANFTIGQDLEGAVADQYKVSVMPTSYIIDRDGVIQETHFGFRDKDKAKLEAVIKAQLQR